MNSQPQLLQIVLDKKDVVYTPDWVARDMVDFFKPSGRILEPAAGDGAFLKYLPGADWCEIEKGRDFYACREHYDWIFGNPPYTDKLDWLRHSMKLAKNIVYLFPCNTPFNSSAIMLDLKEWGMIPHMRYYGTGGEMGFPFGYPCGAIHFQKDYRGPMEISFYEAVV